MGVGKILYSFRLVLEEKTCKEIPESSRLEFLEKFSANNFALSDAEDNTSRPLSRGGIADLPLLRATLYSNMFYNSLVTISKFYKDVYVKSLIPRTEFESGVFACTMLSFDLWYKRL